ncbi:MAG: abscisic acid-deficient protein Aba4 family protein [Pseudomonadota bacterium]
MITTDPSSVFQLANSLALVGWLWLTVWLLLPASVQQRTRMGGLVLPVLLALIYAGSMMVHFSSAQGGFDSLSGVMSLFEHPGATLGGWVHYLAFDLFVG